MFLKDLSETILFGKELTKNLTPKSIILIQGPIGAGKTSLVQGIGHGLSIEENITSPTFALSHHYQSEFTTLIHMDLYRLESEISAKELFFEEEDELENNNGILVIEWPELIMPIVDKYWLIKIDYAENSGRILSIYEPKEPNN